MLKAVQKQRLTEFGIHHRLEGCGLEIIFEKVLRLAQLMVLPGNFPVVGDNGRFIPGISCGGDFLTAAEEEA